MLKFANSAWHLRSLRSALIGALLAAFAGVPTAAATAAPVPAPAWSVVVSSYPTNFAPGSIGGKGDPPGYLLVATNVGGGATSGEFTISDTLPAGLGFSTPAGASGEYGATGVELSCGRTGQTVSCSGGEPTVKPGETVKVQIPVKVEAGAPESVVNSATISGGGLPPVEVTTETTIGGSVPSFGFLRGDAGFSGAVTNADGSLATQAGSHPYQVDMGMGFPSTTAPNRELLAVGGGVRDLAIDLPRGLIVNSGAIGLRCTEAQLENPIGGGVGGCPDESQIGTVAVAFSSGGSPTVSNVALYEMVPPPGAPVEFGMELTEGLYVHLFGGLRSDGDLGLSAEISDISAKVSLLGATVTLWGSPSDASHDYARGSCLGGGGTCPVERVNAAFLTLPGACGGPIATVARADSWLEPGIFATRSFGSPAIDGCNALLFDPTISLRPTTDHADSPTGLEVGFGLPQNDDFDGRAGANLRDAAVLLPPGLVANPSAVSGRGACSSDQIGLASGGEAPVRFDAVPAACPDSAKVGSAEIDSPLIDHPLEGAIYLAKPDENPFGSLLAIYVAIDDPASGVVIKLAGRVEADPGDGRLTVEFAEAPELPIEDVKLSLFAGPRGLLKTPIGCGTYTTGATFTPWTSPEGADATRSSSFPVAAAADGATACPSGEAEAPNKPSFSAGSTMPESGAHVPFVLRLGRNDGSQRLARFETTLPPGLTGKLAGVSYCPDAGVAAASCPAAARVGTVDVGAGAGPAPLHLGGRAYLAGPYKGAPLSLAVLVPAVAGPFDLGTMVVRVALHVDSRSAQVHAVSDPLPTILRGIPLDIRSLAVELDRPGFILNPTSCDPMSVDAVATSLTGQRAALADRFQVAGCSRLGFKPKVGVRLLGPTYRGAHPKFRTVLTARRGDANIRRVTVALPGTELLDNRRIGAVCSAAQFAARQCPSGSVYGHAKAWTPLLDRPLAGPVYLRASDRRLPDLAASLGGQVHLDLVGHIDSVRGHLRNTFQALPDAPLSKVVLTMRGGSRGLLVNTGGLCTGKRRASVKLDSHSGDFSAADPVVKTDCD